MNLTRSRLFLVGAWKTIIFPGTDANGHVNSHVLQSMLTSYLILIRSRVLVFDFHPRRGTFLIKQFIELMMYINSSYLYAVIYSNTNTRYRRNKLFLFESLRNLMFISFPGMDCF